MLKRTERRTRFGSSSFPPLNPASRWTKVIGWVGSRAAVVSLFTDTQMCLPIGHSHHWSFISWNEWSVFKLDFTLFSSNGLEALEVTLVTTYCTNTSGHFGRQANSAKTSIAKASDSVNWGASSSPANSIDNLSFFFLHKRVVQFHLDLWF